MQLIPKLVLENQTQEHGYINQLTSKPTLCVEGDSRKQKDLRSFSLYPGGQGQVPFH